MSENEVLPAISRQIWDDKYRFKKLDGTPIDVTVDDTRKRVAVAIASAEENDANKQAWTSSFHYSMRNFRVIPAGRILAGAGTGRRVTLANCYVMGNIPDDLRSIFDHLTESAVTMQQGGGIGVGFSTLRPRNSELVRTGAFASGPLPFMDTWDAMCRTIRSAGWRRGAMMGILRCDHPDIEEFIEAKRDKNRWRNFNVSVAVTNAFMEAIANDKPWDLVFGEGLERKVYRTIRARDLWNKILRATYDVADPGVFFVDRCNEQHPLYYCDVIVVCNPCGEKPMHPYASCFLTSLNLSAYILDPFTPEARMDFPGLSHDTLVATRFLDNAIDVSNYPLEAQKERAFQAREIGLGVTGLASALLMLGIPYGSDFSFQTAAKWADCIDVQSAKASIDIAREKVCFPLLVKQRYIDGPFGRTFKKLPPGYQKRFEDFGIRNGLRISYAPTGTISLFARNISSVIEPIFADEAIRNITQPDGSRVPTTVIDWTLQMWRDLKGTKTGYPPAWVTANDLTPEQHVRMAAVMQPFVDSAISKTVNVPQDITFEDFRSVYDLAWRLGCKGITTFRPNETTGSILSVASTATESQLPKTGDAPSVITVEPRPAILEGRTYKIKWPTTDMNWYVTITNDGVRPVELFIVTKDVRSQEWVTALSRTITAILRRGGDIKFLIHELQEVNAATSGVWLNQKYCPSIVAAIGQVLEQEFSHLAAQAHMITTLRKGLEPMDEAAPAAPPASAATAQGAPLDARLITGLFCPACNAPTLRRMGPCWICANCQYSSCD